MFLKMYNVMAFCFCIHFTQNSQTSVSWDGIQHDYSMHSSPWPVYHAAALSPVITSWCQRSNRTCLITWSTSRYFWQNVFAVKLVTEVNWT